MHRKYNHAARGTAFLGLRRGLLSCFGLALLLCSPRMAVAQSVTWSETWEAGQGSWSILGDSPHVWEVGTPTVGPSSPHGGTQCAGTILADNYPGSADSRLISPLLTLPASPPDGKLWLSFWQWFHISNGNGDWGAVEVSPDSGRTWVRLSRAVESYSGDVWTRRLEDLSPYAGQTVLLAFHMVSGMWGGGVPGWYVDDVEVLQGPLEAWSPEGFEDGLGGWSMDRGVWEVGTPMVGPSSPHGGTQCAGTILADNYPGSADSRLISPPLTLPSSPPGGKLWLSFWQWFHLGDGDWGAVEISTDNGATWTPLSRLVISYSGDVWTRRLEDLSPYAGQTVRVAFRMVSGMWSVYWPGWYVDDVEVLQGPLEAWSPEGFEDGLGGWSMDRGVWEVGTPTVGPSSPHGGTQCAGTILADNYSASADSRLISPPLTLPSSPPGGKLWLSFWQWFQLGDGDWGAVEISDDNGSTWTQLGPLTTGSSDDWVPMELEISNWIGRTVRVAFRMVSGQWSVYWPGWYVDDINIIEGGTSGVEPPKPPSEHVAALSLSLPSPNPVHGALAISFALPEDRLVRIAVFDAGGRRVATIADGYYTSGTHQIRWSAPNGGGPGLSSGVYFVRLMAGGETRVQKMLYVE